MLMIVRNTRIGISLALIDSGLILRLRVCFSCNLSSNASKRYWILRRWSASLLSCSSTCYLNF